MSHSEGHGTGGLVALIASLRRLLESAGGFTVHHRTGRPAIDGVSVCAVLEAELHFPMAEWDDVRVGSWVRTWADRVRGSDLHLGGWLDPTTGHVWLDVVRVLPADRLGDAVHLGRELRQRAVFDLALDRVVGLAPVGGGC
jgi:hypothetical protein